MTNEMPVAVYTEPGKLQVESRPIPSPGPTEVLVEVSHCGICGTDLHMIIEGWGTPGSISGHEFSGTITDVGADVDGWTVGEKVVAEPLPTCGHCPKCRDGRPSLCDNRVEPGPGLQQQGAFASYTVVDQVQLTRIPDGLDMREAAFAEPLAVSLHALSVAGTKPGDRVLVMGAGPIGVCAVAALRAQGVDDVTVCEPNDERREMAVEIGATATCVPSDLDVPNIAEPGRMVDGAYDVVIECSGKKSAVEAAHTQLTRGGTLVLVGTGIEPPDFDTNRIILNELVITGSYNYDRAGLATALEMIASGDLRLDLLIEPGVVSLSEMEATMHGLFEGRIKGKVMVVPEI